MKILIIEDDNEIRELIKYFLEKEKFKTVEADNGMDGLRLVREYKPDLIILDIMLPALDGINVCNMIRGMPEKYGDPMIILTTAKSDTNDVLEGLASGADDYLKKPYDPRELIMRINTIFRRTNKNIDKVIKFMDITINNDKHTVTENDIEIELSKKEYELLIYLIKNASTTLTREKIINNVWETEYYQGDRTVDVYIGKLRDKFKNISDNIKTVKGIGYKLEPKKV